MIKGISDIRRLPRLGKIHLGEKEVSQRSGNEFPVARPYFVVNDDDFPRHPAVAQAIRARYGEKPTELRIMFPSGDREIIFPQALKAYKASGLWCRGDGETAVRVKEGGGFFEMPCPYHDCEIYQKKGCTEVAILTFLLPEITVTGTVQIDTGSRNAIIQINSALDLYEGMFGRISMMPFRLVVEPKEVAPDGKKKVVFVMGLYTEQMLPLASLQEFHAQAMAMVPAYQQRALPAPDPVTGEIRVEGPDHDEQPTHLFPNAAGQAEKPKVNVKSAPPLERGNGGKPKPPAAPPPTEKPADPQKDPAPNGNGGDIEARIKAQFDALNYPENIRAQWVKMFPDPEDRLKKLMKAEPMAPTQAPPPAAQAASAGPGKKKGTRAAAKTPVGAPETPADAPQGPSAPEIAVAAPQAPQAATPEKAPPPTKAVQGDLFRDLPF